VAKNFRTEHVAKVPRGWHVRTVTQGDHEVRIAFPAGRRKTGSGHVVEILHPTHENPGVCPSRTRMQNPAELVLMGANPISEDQRKSLIERFVKQGMSREGAAAMVRQGERVIASHPKSSARKAFKKYHTSHSNPRGHRYAVKWHTGNISQAFTSEEEARHMLDRFHGAGEIIRVNPMPLRRSNPADLVDAAQARDVRQGFVDHPIDGDSYANEPHVPAGNYAQLGQLAYLVIAPVKSMPVLQIDLEDRGILVVSSTDRKRMYFVKGRHSLSDAELSRFNSEDGETIELGECRQIGYLAVKYHPEVGNDAAGKVVLWEHPFESPRPTVWYSLRDRRLLLRGGNYRVEDAGIVG
jgi:hypothetical protein